MKNKSFITALLLLLCATSLWASNTSVDGIWYDFNNSTMTATVTYRGSAYDQYTNEYTGDVTIPESVTYYAQTYSVTSIGYQAFYGCSSLTSVTIPNSVTSIGNSAFSNCSSLTSPVYNEHVFACMPTSYSGDYSIPEGIESIAGGAFSNCSSLTSIDIPNSVTSIGDWAFSNCSSLTSVTIPNSVTSIGRAAFSGCTSLTSITIPNSVTSIGNSAFSNCSSLPIENNIRYADTYLVETVDKSLSSYTIKEGTRFIGNYAFYNCSSLTSVTIPNSVTSIGGYAFYNCSSLTSIVIPDGVPSIGDYTFYNCSSLTSATIGNSVTSIGYEAFYNCSNVETIYIGSAMETIGESAFSGCQRIIDIYSYAQRVPTVYENTFDGVSRRAYLWVPENRKRNYWTHEIWGQFIVQVTGAESVNATNVSVVPDYSSAQVIWPAVDNADSYDIDITDPNGNSVCSLTFDSEGYLRNIAFAAPSRNNAPARDKGTGFSFEVTGLEESTQYDYSIAAKDATDTTIQTFFGSFQTLGSTTALDEIHAGVESTQKILRDGQLLILRDGKTYTVQGQEVR